MVEIKDTAPAMRDIGYEPTGEVRWVSRLTTESIYPPVAGVVGIGRQVVQKVLQQRWRPQPHLGSGDMWVDVPTVNEE